MPKRKPSLREQRQRKRRSASRGRREPVQQPVQLTGTPLPPNAGVEAAYVGELTKLTRAMVRRTKQVLAALTADGTATFLASAQGQMAMGSLQARMTALFEAKARDMAVAMLRANLKSGANSLGVSLEAMSKAAGKAAGAAGAAGDTGQTLKELSQHVTLKAQFSPELKAGLQEAVEANVKLIRSIPVQFYDKAGNIVSENIKRAHELRDATVNSLTTGQGLHDLIPQIEHLGGVTRERARCIAVDQTRKANAFIASRKMQDAGITRFRWRHSAGSATPRPYHKDELDGNVYDLANPPVIDLGTGETGLPGQLINCRCTMEPVLDSGDTPEADA